MKKLGLLLVIAFLYLNALNAGEIRLKNEGSNAIRLKTNTYNLLKVKHLLSVFESTVIKTDKGFFCELGVNGYSNTASIGQPKLPVRRELIEIPAGATVKLEITQSTYTEYSLSELGIDYAIIPAQPPVPKTNAPVPPLVIDQQAYQNNQFSPTQLATVDEIGIMRGLRLGRLNIFPFQYNPVTKKMRIYDNLDIKIVFENADIPLTLVEKRKNDNPYFMGINKMILNYKPLPVSKDTITRFPVRYVIVSDPMFQSALQPLIYWKRIKGFTVTEAYTNDPLVGNTTASIKAYLQGLYQNATADNPAPTFVLLVGDNAQIPSYVTSGGHMADKFFGEYTGDDIPEVIIGRMSAENESQLSPQLNKTLEYEKYEMPDPSYLNEVVMVAGMDANYGVSHGNGQINYGTDYYYNLAHGITSHTYLYPQSGPSASQIIQDVSNGVGFANYTAHGSSGGWADPGFSVADVDGLQNAHKYPLMIGNCCLTNKFDDPVCFGEALLRANNKGALGYIGGSNVSYWNEDFYWAVGVRSITPPPVWAAGEQMGAYDVTFHDHGEPYSQWYITQGLMNFAGNMAVTIGSPGSSSYYWEIYHLMGDPSLMVYYSVPPANNVTYNSLMPLAVNSFTVNADPYSYVAISQNGVLHGALLADSTGLAVVTIDPITSPGYATIVVTAQNRQPFIDSIVVASPAGPYVLLDSYQTVETTGNNNNQVDFGESISLNLSLKNWGLADATNVTTTLSSSDPYVTITNSSAIFGIIASGAMATQNNAFSFDVAGNLPDQHKAIFNLTINDNAGNTWNGSFKVTLNAPVLVVTDMTIDDASGGNDNGKLDPGETVNFNIITKNTGHSDASSTLGTLASFSSLITLNTTTSNLNVIAAGASGIASFNATVSSAATTGDFIPLDYLVASGPYSALKTFSPAVGLIREDWESGTTTHFDWMFGGSLPWTISTESPYEGAYCLKSGAITDLQTSDLLITGDVMINDTLSFYRKVSSENNWDWLKFSVDDNVLDQWSGEKSWQKVSFPVTTGTHTFKWSYTKDDSYLTGADAAWIDFITLPAMTGIITSIDQPQDKQVMWQLFPNPANSSTQLSIYLEKSQQISLRIYNSMGQEVKVLVNENNMAAGIHTQTVNTSQYARGVYFVHLETAGHHWIKKLVVQ
ncbi:MAG: C25 family cysteine peptidase [Bacteroidetes bacterium]|nr:C25 family cysteine peptidase [Bacteroidota bacterium]